MTIIINFLKDGAKIVFGSAVVGFFFPGFGGQVTSGMFLGGSVATITMLALAIGLSKLKLRKKL